jgi:hypothetical protein
VPIWAAGYAGRRRPLRRAASVDGFFPVELRHPDQLAEIDETIRGLRPDPTAPYDIAVPFATRCRSRCVRRCRRHLVF